jgi:DNA-binding transcriptional ArsR family regulator
MTPDTVQIAVQRVTDLAAARALRQDNDFLAHFIDPVSPSEVATKLGMAANLAHHHATKLAALGLLFEQRREGGKVFYQLVAREFRVPSELLPPGDEAGNGTSTIRELSAAFLHAYERSWQTMHGGEEDVFGFGNTEQPAYLDQPPHDESDEPYPTHSDIIMLRLTPERFARLARAFTALIDEVQAEGVSKSGSDCTLAVLAFASSEESEGRRTSRSVNSFLGGLDGGK